MKDKFLKKCSMIFTLTVLLLLISISFFSIVNGQNIYPPVANLNLNTALHDNQEAVYVLEPAYFDGSNSYDPDGSNITFEWDYGDGNTGTGITSEHIYQKVGFYEVSLTVSDGNFSSTSTMNIIVISTTPHPPVANGGSSQEVNSTDIVTLDASNSYDPDGDPLTYIWDFGDGSENGYGVTTTHQYDKEGIYQVTITVKDNYHTSNDTVIIKVGEGPVINPNPPPDENNDEDENAIFIWLTIIIVVVVLVLFFIAVIVARRKKQDIGVETTIETKRPTTGSIQSEIDDLLSGSGVKTPSRPPMRSERGGSSSRRAPMRTGAMAAQSGKSSRGRPTVPAAAMSTVGKPARRGGRPKDKDAKKGGVGRTIDVDAYRKRLADLEKKEEKKREAVLKKQLEMETKKMEKEMEKDLRDLGLDF